MEKMRKTKAQKNNRRHMMIIGFIFYVAIVRDNEALDNKIEVLVNDTVSIYCHANAPIDIQWHFNSMTNFLYAGRRFYQHGDRMRLENNNGTYTLIIPEVRSEDAGWYYCSEEISGRRISSTHLTVLYSNPVCSSNMHPDGFIGPNTCNVEQENMVFNCVVSFNGISPPILIWRLLNDNRTLNSSICEDKPNRRNCSLILTSDPIYDGSIFICQTKASIDSRFNCSTEGIKTMYFSSPNDTAKKYVNDNVNCSANSNLNVKYNWTLKQNNKVTLLSSNQNLVIQKPGIYQCEVNYSIRNYTCLSIAYVMNVSVENTNGGTTPGTLALAIILPTVLAFLVLSAGMFTLQQKLKKRRQRREDKRKENERIRKKIEEMRKDFVLNVDPEDVLDLLIQKHIISRANRAKVLTKETTEDSCRALLDHLSSSFHIEAFIVLQKALSECYPWIAAGIDAIDSSPFITIQENERIKDKIISMYIDFTSEVDPKNVFDLLNRRRIVSIEELQCVMNKDTAEDRCRALIYHLFCSSKENAFIILRESIKKHYLTIVGRIDASDADNGTEYVNVTGKQENERIRNRLVAIYEEFVSEVDPKKVLDLLIQKKVVNVRQRHYLENQVTKENQCEALLDHLFSCSKDNVFIILKEALKEQYPTWSSGGNMGIVDSLTIDDEYQNNSDERSTMRLDSSIVAFGKDDASKINLNRPNEVSAQQELPNALGIFMAAAVYCGSFFVIGIGNDKEEIWRFDARYSKWNKCASLIKGRVGSSVTFVDEILYICGGRRLYRDVFDKIDCYDVLDDVEAYDALDDRCNVVGKLNYAVYFAGNCLHYKASLYIFGGINAHNNYVNSVQVYNTKLNSCSILKNPMPSNRYLLCVALHNNYFILLGAESCFLYNFDTETWDVRDQFQSNNYSFGMIVHDDKLFVFGGTDYNGILQDVVRYVPILNILKDESIEWKPHAKLTKPFQVYACGRLEYLAKRI